MIRGYKYRIYPNVIQKKQIDQMLGNARFIYNWALNRRVELYQNDKKNISVFTLMHELTQLKKQPEYEWLTLSYSQTLQQSIINMDKAFTRFFREKHKFPQFKKKGKCKQTIGFPQGTKIDFLNNKISVAKIKWMKAKISRKFEGKIKTSTISKTPTDKYFIAILVDLPDLKVKQKPIRKKNAIGIDTGIKTFAVFSDGTKIENPKHLRASLQRLKILQRRMSKKTKGSNNRNKARKKVALLHEQITNQRLDFLHKLTTSIAKKYDTVVCENLDIVGMIKKPYLAQSVLDLGLGEFYEFLTYKMKDQGGNYLEIGRFEPSSKMCSCGVINNDLKLSDRIWTCKSCGETHDRDELASKNILKFGLQKQNLIRTVGPPGIACGDVGNG